MKIVIGFLLVIIVYLCIVLSQERRNRSVVQADEVVIVLKKKEGVWHVRWLSNPDKIGVGETFFDALADLVDLNPIVPLREEGGGGEPIG